MTGIESLFTAAGTWFGFVGSCVAGAGYACRPFLAFVALTAAAGVALALLVLAYRALKNERMREVEELHAREPQASRERTRASDISGAPRPAQVGGWQISA